jgi:tRNA threonylcarbamoyladenosine biosynthesis protein TsaE
MKNFITTNSIQTKKLGELLAGELRGGKVICLSGDLGSGKTTFTQGLLKGLKVRGPYTSPTFVIMKKYKNNIFHFDVYRVGDKDILNLGWEEIIADKNNVIIVEWADRIKKIVPKKCLWVKFELVDPPRVDERSSRVEAGENKRKIIFNN